jgi:hypothetical protein
MSMPRLPRFAMLAVAGATLAMALMLGGALSPAAASPRAGSCLLPGILCPTTTVPRTVTTTAPVTTVPPTTHPTTATTAAPNKTTATTSPKKSSSSQPSVGVAGLPVTGSINLPAIGADTVPAAPQLAGTPTPTVSTVLYSPPTVLSGLVGATTRGLPNDHATLRIALSLLALVIAAVALAQVPGSRRSPRSRP